MEQNFSCQTANHRFFFFNSIIWAIDNNHHHPQTSDSIQPLNEWIDITSLSSSSSSSGWTIIVNQ
ncbi:hypothetical protein DERF_011139 [Dermatophagoides farinae]|uniref:Uncharacterized protein n=1 Tax=Dermatophagoides farinae TaxID=6954 RepID=A0A922HRN1_DERFA|nr:hypothetical protein DERF_011139 [Dermatophagoides farinae]